MTPAKSNPKHHANTLFSTNTEYKTNKFQRKEHTQLHNELHTAIAVDAFIAYRVHNQDLRIIKAILEYKYGIYAKMHHIESFVNSPYKPEKGLLIKELFKLGYTTDKIEEWTGASKANISYHKLNDKEYDYFDKGINFLLHNPYGNITKDE